MVSQQSPGMGLREKICLQIQVFLSGSLLSNYTGELTNDLQQILDCSLCKRSLRQLVQLRYLMTMEFPVLGSLLQNFLPTTMAASFEPAEGRAENR